MARTAAIKAGSKTKHDIGGTIGLIVLFTILAILIILPIYALFIASFKPGEQLLQYGLNLTLNFKEWSLSNYKLLFFGHHDYWIWFRNSMILTIITVIATLFVSAFVAYGFAAYDFKFKNVLFILVLAIMSVPFEVIMLPLYKQMTDWGMMDNYAAIVLPFMAHASTIFFFRQYMQSLPKELLDAARIDGCTEYGISVKIMMPITKPAFASMAILCAMGSWNNMLWPMLVFRDTNKFTLQIGLNTLLTPYGNNYDLLIAGSMFGIIPILIIYLIFQKYLIDGMTAGAVKG